MKADEVTVVGITFSARLQGSHVQVVVRGFGPVGHRPLLGTLRMRPDEWEALRDAEFLVNEPR